MLWAPLYLFKIFLLVSVRFFFISFSLTNFLLINLLGLVSFISFIYCNASHMNYLQETSFFYSPNSWQKGIESIFEITAQLISDIISTGQNIYFPVISNVFNWILLSNLIGLIPYSFTPTSHLIMTFILSFSLFFGINIITFMKHKVKTFGLFLPHNTAFLLALLLSPIELISYVAKPISLGVRLFINLMAGHSLLKVIVGFSWDILLLKSFFLLGFSFTNNNFSTAFWFRSWSSLDSSICFCYSYLSLCTRNFGYNFYM